MKAFTCLLLLLFCNNFFVQNKKAQDLSDSSQRKIDKIIIKSVSFDILTFADISCEKFNSFAENQHCIHETTNHLEIQQILDILFNILPIDNNDYNGMDTRAKIYLFSENDRLDSVCVGRFTLEKEGELYKTPIELLEYIREVNLD